MDYLYFDLSYLILLISSSFYKSSWSGLCSLYLLLSSFIVYLIYFSNWLNWMYFWYLLSINYLFIFFNLFWNSGHLFILYLFQISDLVFFIYFSFLTLWNYFHVLSSLHIYLFYCQSSISYFHFSVYSLSYHFILIFLNHYIDLFYNCP